MNDLTTFEANAVAIAVLKLLNERHFNIIAFDQIAKKLGVVVDAKEHASLHLLHCVDYADMPQPFRDQVRAKVVELLGLPPHVFEGESSRVEPSPTSTAKPRPKLLAFLRGGK